MRTGVSTRLRGVTLVRFGVVSGLVAAALLVTARPTPAGAVAGSFLPITVSNSCTLTTGFSISGSATCGANAQTNGQTYFYLSSAGSSITYSFTVPSGGSEVLTYGIPADGYLNNVDAFISVDGGAATAVDSNEGPSGSTTSTDLPLWTSSSLGSGSHTWTITTTGDFVNAYGLWIQGGAAFGTATMSVAPTTVQGDTSGNTLSFLYTAPAGGLNGGAIAVTVPTDWSSPSSNPMTAGYTTFSGGGGSASISFGGQSIAVRGVKLSEGQTVTVLYGDRSRGGPGASSPFRTEISTFSAEQAPTATSAFTALSTSPAVSVSVLFDDEFAGSSLSSAWLAANGANPNNGEQECYDSNNVVVNDGLEEQAAVGSVENCYCPPTPPSVEECPYVSGAVQWSSLGFTYGTVSVRAKFAGGTGTWPAIWLLGTNCQSPEWITSGSKCDWPQSGANEIDIAEILDSNHDTVSQGVWTAGSSGNTVHLPKYPCRASESDVSTHWHTYTLIWSPGSLTWEVDGVKTCNLTEQVPSTPMFLIINTAVGGVGAGSVNSSTLPQATEVQYVRVAQ